MMSRKQQTMEMAQSAIEGWIPVSISEKKLPDGATSFLVAFRKPEHAHLPFDKADKVPNIAKCYIWADQDNYTDLPLEQLRDFSKNPRHPSITDIVLTIKMQQHVDGMQN